MNQIKRIMAIDPWQIKSDTLEIEDRRLQESLTAIGNGYMGMRGNLLKHTLVICTKVFI